MSSAMQSFVQRLLQYAEEDQDDLMYNNTMERVNDTSSFQDKDGVDIFDNNNPLAGLSNLTDDNIMSWFDNSTYGLWDNSTNATTNDIFNAVGYGSDHTGDDDGGTFDPKVFWCVNAFIFALFLTTVLWCFFGKKEWLFHHSEDRRQASDEIYRQNVLQRRREQQEAKKETPAQRTKKLLKSFAVNKVQMTVKEEDLIEDDPYHTPEEDNTMMDDIETGSLEDRGQLKLANGNLVPNCCAICLTCYDVGDVVIWSSNEACAHAFHQDCVVGWLVKMQPETPCPCCRQEFTDLESVRKEAKVTWGRNAFNINAVTL